QELNDIKSVDLKELMLEYCPDRSGYASFFKGYPELYSHDHNMGYENLIIQAANDPYVLNHDFMTILNLRRYFTSSYWFYLCKNLLFNGSCELLLISQQEYSMIDMEPVLNSSDLPIEDNIFSMSKALFLDYIEYLSTDKSQKTHKEKLWSFSEDKKFYIVERVGLVRNDWDINKQDFAIDNLTYS
ncbi:MAG: hypothetical protein H8E98_07550, partial [Bacteroidetes bacterium]|nr:hypothetical protein [Bacteroidota bacterium]